MSKSAIADSWRPFYRGWLVALAALMAIPVPWAGAGQPRGVGGDSIIRGAASPLPDQADAKRPRLREGSKVQTTGYFRTTGDRITFYADDGKKRYRGLENLMLERIGRTIEDSPGQLQWTVTGTVTEYRGANFLLVTHAVLTTDAGRTAPGQLPRLDQR
jgi:hypothetical protein